MFVMACLSVMAQPTGPWNNPLMMTTSMDGQQFDLPTVFQDSAGVPSLIRWKGDTLVAAFQWFRQPKPSPTWDRVAVKFSYDNGQSWTTPVPIQIPDLPAGYQRPFDPTLVVLDDLSIRMYFSSSAIPPMGLDETVNTYSATSADGIHYTFDPGIRVDHPTKPVIDPAVIRFKNLWHYTAPAGAPQDGAHHYTSTDGLTFSEQASLPSDNTHNWTGNLMLESPDLVRFYGAGPGGIWFSESDNGATWGLYQPTNIQGGDPTVLKRNEDDYLMIYVGPPGTSGWAEPSLAYESFQVIQTADQHNLRCIYTLNRPAQVGFQITDLLGRPLHTSAPHQTNPGTQETMIPLDTRINGVVFVTILADQESMTRRIFLLP